MRLAILRLPWRGLGKLSPCTGPLRESTTLASSLHLQDHRGKALPRCASSMLFRLVPSQHGEEQDKHLSSRQTSVPLPITLKGNQENISEISNPPILSSVTLRRSYKSSGGEGEVAVSESVEWKLMWRTCWQTTNYTAVTQQSPFPVKHNAGDEAPRRSCSGSDYLWSLVPGSINPTASVAENTSSSCRCVTEFSWSAFPLHLDGAFKSFLYVINKNEWMKNGSKSLSGNHGRFNLMNEAGLSRTQSL